MNEQDRQSVITAGTMSTLLLENLQPLFKQIEEESTNKLKNLFKAGELTDVAANSCAAELQTVERLKNLLKGNINKANSASRKQQREG